MAAVQRSKRLSSVKLRQSAEVAEPVPSDLLALENGRLTEALAAASTLGERIATENRQLQLAAADQERESFEVGQYLRKELEDRKHELAELAERKREAERQAEQQLWVLRQRLESERDEAGLLAAETEAALRQHVQDLEGRLASVAGFREQQGSIAREMQFLRSERDRAKKKIGEQAKAHVVVQQQSWDELTSQHQLAISALEAAHAAGLESSLDARSAAVHQHNGRLRAELKMHAEETMRMHAELQELRDRQAALQREAALQRGLEEQYSRRSTARELTAARKESVALAAKIREADAAFQAQLQAAIDAAAADRAAAEAEIDTLRRMIELKAHELKRLKALSQTVLQQRSDIEHFLLSSLEMVQAEIAQRRKPHGAGAVSAEAEPAAGAAAAHFDVRDLTWEDREKVLRLLFAKLNDPKQQTFFEKMPAHIQG